MIDSQSIPRMASDQPSQQGAQDLSPCKEEKVGSWHSVGDVYSFSVNMLGVIFHVTGLNMFHVDASMF